MLFFFSLFPLTLGGGVDKKNVAQLKSTFYWEKKEVIAHRRLVFHTQQALTTPAQEQNLQHLHTRGSFQAHSSSEFPVQFHWNSTSVLCNFPFFKLVRRCFSHTMAPTAVILHNCGKPTLNFSWSSIKYPSMYLSTPAGSCARVPDGTVRMYANKSEPV